MSEVARASAPASIGNVGVGFDVLGQAFDAVRDSVTARRAAKPGVRLGAVTGIVETLPSRPDKQIPVSAGMGGSAASAVAAAAAVNALLPAPFKTADLLPFAMEGEAVSADPPPWDNVIASLLGGLAIAARLEPALIASLPTPPGVSAVLFHPDAKTETAAARGVLAEQVPMHAAVEHARRISAFTLGCATGDRALIRAGLEDILVEPQRAFLLPALPAVKAAALNAGALGCSFSGSGPSLFAWVDDACADRVEAAMADAFAQAGLGARAYRAPLASAGVRLEPVAEAVR